MNIAAVLGIADEIFSADRHASGNFSVAMPTSGTDALFRELIAPSSPLLHKKTYCPFAIFLMIAGISCQNADNYAAVNNVMYRSQIFCK
ncbi:hypothetical protein [Herbaspirillum rhizosphaerae]|uniref:hypothetical protein n=1 Tax=Herbaspirillum rhizosphaerae TaxID=346179 RepID=UPI0012EDCE7F|nr:hypothetical protein [Herbaspirillum rhizosphaerae]